MASSNSVALVGVGYWGPNYLRLVTESESFTLKVVCDKDPTRFEIKGLKKSNAKLFIDPLLAISSDVDCVILSTPATTHYELCKLALKAGKHVLVEKPLTLSLTQAKELFEIAKQNHLVLMAGQVYLYNNAIRFIRERLKSRRVLHLAHTRTGLGPIRNDVNAVWDLAIHDFAITTYLTQFPEIVWGVGEALLGELEDTALCFLKMSSSIASIRVSWLDPLKRREISIVTQEEMIIFDDTNTQEPVKIYERGAQAQKLEGSQAAFKFLIKNGPVISPFIPYEEPLALQLERFAQRIEACETPYTWEDEVALRAVVIAEAVNMSIKKGGQEVKLIDPISLKVESL